MIIWSHRNETDDRVYSISFTAKEWAALIEGKKQSRPVGWSGGWFRLDVKFTKVPDPYTRTCDYAGCKKLVYPNYDSMFCKKHGGEDIPR